MQLVDKETELANKANIINDFYYFVEILPDAAIIIRENWEIEWLNSRAEKFFSFDAKSHHNQSILKLISRELSIYLQQKNFDTPIRVRSTSKQAIPLEIQVLPYSQHHLLILAKDISDSERLEQMRNDFIANVSHEIRTPITVIIGYLETLQSIYTKDKMLLNALHSMNTQTDRMSNIINDLLVLSSMQAKSIEQPQVINIPLMLNNLVAELKTAYQDKQQDIRCEIDEQVKLIGDEQILYSLFSNLINNAIRYTPAQGVIHIRWYLNEFEHQCFEVSDNGIGIAQKHIDHLTERFYRVNKSRSRKSGGSGLGLSIVKHALAQHHGELTINSTLGHGSRFHCEFEQSEWYGIQHLL